MGQQQATNDCWAAADQYIREAYCSPVAFYCPLVALFEFRLYIQIAHVSIFIVLYLLQCICSSWYRHWIQQNRLSEIVTFLSAQPPFNSAQQSGIWVKGSEFLPHYLWLIVDFKFLEWRHNYSSNKDYSLFDFFRIQIVHGSRGGTPSQILLCTLLPGRPQFTSQHLQHPVGLIC
jgi:hypothetical protein